MDYEEKYKEALDKANVIHKCGNNQIKQIMEKVFPELAESEDEKIRKAIIDFISTYEYPELIDKEVWVTWLEKLGEQNTANKVEPKFKVGDWIISNDKDVHNDYRVCKITKIVDDRYYIENGDFLSESSLEQYGYRLWTIQDAKDGDVLATDNDSICIFDGTVEEGKYPFAHCGLTRHGFESYDKKLPFTHVDFHPATKEQRELLFQKMGEAGYEWDAEKKELKLLITNGGDFESENCEQKSAWSEEDEEKLNQLHKLIVKEAYKEYEIDTEDETLYGKWLKLDNWLKSLKNRVQLQWEPSSQHIAALEYQVNSTCKGSWQYKASKELLEQLKKL